MCGVAISNGNFHNKLHQGIEHAFTGLQRRLSAMGRDAVHIILSLNHRASSASTTDNVSGSSRKSIEKEAVACIEKALLMTSSASSWFSGAMVRGRPADDSQEELRVALRCLILGTFASHCRRRGEVEAVVAHLKESIEIGQTNQLVATMPVPEVHGSVESTHDPTEYVQQQVYCNTRIAHLLQCAQCISKLSTNSNNNGSNSSINMDNENNERFSQGHQESLKLLIQALHLTQRQLQEVHTQFDVRTADDDSADGVSGALMAHFVGELTLQLLVVYFNIASQYQCLQNTGTALAFYGRAHTLAQNYSMQQHQHQHQHRQVQLFLQQQQQQQLRSGGATVSRNAAVSNLLKQVVDTHHRVQQHADSAHNSTGEGVTAAFGFEPPVHITPLPPQMLVLPAILSQLKRQATFT